MIHGNSSHNLCFRVDKICGVKNDSPLSTPLMTKKLPPPTSPPFVTNAFDCPPTLHLNIIKTKIRFLNSEKAPPPYLNTPLNIIRSIYSFFFIFIKILFILNKINKLFFLPSVKYFWKKSAFSLLEQKNLRLKFEIPFL